jgi:SAM-dependent methyltransferase
VHDKKQGKFRQINKFLEYVEEVYSELPRESVLTVYDLCCGKSYLSFAVYHYLTVMKGRQVKMLGVDLKRDVIEFCNEKAKELGFFGMQFVTDDITNTPKDVAPDMVISLHACDIATDIVLDTAAKLGAKVILSTPCCHRELSTKIDAPVLSFVTKYPKLKRSLCDSLTDALRLERLSYLGYDVNATELVDPEDTPKNTLIRAVKRRAASTETSGYTELLRFLLGEGADDYIGKL